MRGQIIISLLLLLFLALGAAFVRWPRWVAAQSQRWLDEHPHAPALRLPQRMVVPFVRAVGVVSCALALYYFALVWWHSYD